MPATIFTTIAAFKMVGGREYIQAIFDVEHRLILRFV